MSATFAPCRSTKVSPPVATHQRAASAYSIPTTQGVGRRLSDAALLRDLLQAAADASFERGADAVLCLHAAPALPTALQQAGYRMRQPSRYLLVRPGPIEGLTRERLLSPDGWFVTQGDSDIDRPW